MCARNTQTAVVVMHNVSGKAQWFRRAIVVLYHCLVLIAVKMIGKNFQQNNATCLFIHDVYCTMYSEAYTDQTSFLQRPKGKAQEQKVQILPTIGKNRAFKESKIGPF